MIGEKKKPLSCGTAQDISHLRLRYPLGTWSTRVFRRFGRIRELPLLPASRLQRQDPPSLGWTYYDSLGPASDGPAGNELACTFQNSICTLKIFEKFSCVKILDLLEIDKNVPLICKNLNSICERKECCMHSRVRRGG